MEISRPTEFFPGEHLNQIVAKFSKRLDLFKQAAQESNHGHDSGFMVIINQSVDEAKIVVDTVVKLIDPKQLENKKLLESLDLIIGSDPDNEDIFAEDALWSFPATLGRAFLPEDHPLIKTS